MISAEAFEKVERTIGQALDNVFGDGRPLPLPAALVMFDSDARLFYFGGYNTAFEKVVRRDRLAALRTSGMKREKGGLLDYASSRFDLNNSQIWGYAIRVDSNPKELTEAALTNSESQKWERIGEDKCTPGRQLVEFADVVKAPALSSTTPPQYLIILPYSITQSLDGLVLLVWIENESPSKQIPAALDFFSLHGAMLSAVQMTFAAKIEAVRADGYKLLASLVRHEDNGFSQTVDKLVAKLEKALEKGRGLIESVGITGHTLDFLATKIDNKKDLNKELSGHNPLYYVPEELLYSSGTHLVEDLARIVVHVNESLKARQLLDNLDFSIEVTPVREEIRRNPRIQLKFAILERIIRNAVKNSVHTALVRRRTALRIRMSIDVAEENGQYLYLSIEDDAGGLEEECKDIPREITPAVWLRYRQAREERLRRQDNRGKTESADPEKGNGFLLIARYTISSGGEFFIEDVVSDDRVIGLLYKIKIGLPRIPVISG